VRLKLRLLGFPIVDWELAREKRAIYNTNESPSDFIRDIGLGRSTKSGTTVDEDSALACSAVFSCVRILSETLASLPLSVYRRTKQGREKFYDHPVYTLVHDEPNPFMTSFVFKQVMMVFASLWGNAYAVIERDTKERPVALNVIHPSHVSPQIIKDKLFYVIMIPGQQKRTVISTDMVHVPGLTVDGITGVEIADKAKEAIGLALAAEGFGADFFGNGANSDVILSYPGRLSGKGKDNLGDSFDKKYRGENSGKTIVLEEGTKMEKR